MAVWWGLAMLVHLSQAFPARPAIENGGTQPPSLLGILLIPAFALMITLLVTFVRLNRVAHWLCIVYLSLWTLLFTTQLALFLWKRSSAGQSSLTVRAVTAVGLFWLLIVGVNAFCVWHLGRRKFRNACDAYLKEKRMVG